MWLIKCIGVGYNIFIVKGFGIVIWISEVLCNIMIRVVGGIYLFVWSVVLLVIFVFFFGYVFGKI